jgi:hypothetical protein
MSLWHHNSKRGIWGIYLYDDMCFILPMIAYESKTNDLIIGWLFLEFNIRLLFLE